MKIAEQKKLQEIPYGIDNNRILELVQQYGFKLSFFVNLLKSYSHADNVELSSWLNISEKTFRNYTVSTQSTRPLVLEHTIMLLSLFKHGQKIFGKAEQFKKWLDEENFYFDKRPPIAFMDTISGIKFIDDRLTAMEYGDNA